MIQPTLRKSKSNLRQRLGLTNRTNHPMPITAPSTTNLASTIVGPHPSSTAYRPDSRQAFVDSIPNASKRKPDFDTISYNSQMSASAVGYEEETTAETLVSSEGTRTSMGSAAQFQQSTPQNSPSYRAVNQHRAPAEGSPRPNNPNTAPHADDIFSLTDQQLSDQFTFMSEVGYGNWGSVWVCKPKDAESAQFTQGAMIRLGRQAAAAGGAGADGKVALKLVHRSKTPTTAARVRALWGEMKIIRSLRLEPHPSIIQFEAFVITPSYALVIMPYMSHLIPVCLDPSVATPYFRQLASAVGYLHDRGITHNDIKPANVLLSYSNVPVLVDFGFAQKWDVGSRGAFLSSISWGTPEYLDPQRARGMPHDERASDVWSLGITMFEILVGRTPFETDDQEQFSTPEELVVYYERTKRGEWIGEWDIPEDIENLLRRMIHPDPARRISAIDAYQDRCLQSCAPSVIITPQFVRTAATFDEEDTSTPARPDFVDENPAGAVISAHMTSKQVAESTEGRELRKTKRKTKRTGQSIKEAPTYSTTPALGESIKQHAAVGQTRKENVAGKENEVIIEVVKKQSKLVIKKVKDGEAEEKKTSNATNAKDTKPTQPLRVQEFSYIADKKVVPRTSNSQLTNLSRTSSATSNRKELNRVTSLHTLKDRRVSALSGATYAKDKQEAVLRTMRSLEGTRKHFTVAQRGKAQEAFAHIKRPAPSPPRPRSLDSAVEKEKYVDERRSLGLDRALLGVFKEELAIKNEESKDELGKQQKTPPVSPPRAKRTSAHRLPTPSPQKSRRQGIRPHAQMDATTGKVFPASDDESPLSELREKIVLSDQKTTASDQEKLVRFRPVSVDLVETLRLSEISHKSPSSSRVPTPVETPFNAEARLEPRRVSEETVKSMPALSRTKSIEQLTMDSRLDKMSNWIKSVEAIIEDARRAVSEGREPGLPVLTVPTEIAGDSQEHRFGVTPDKSNAIPHHLRTNSLQVEPSTPPKWMTYEEAEEQVKVANKWIEEQGRKKKERPTVGHVLKLFGGDKEKPDTASGSRSGTPEPGHFVPLKPPAPALRGVPSTPALRASAAVRQSKVPHRKSESNLRNFNTVPAMPSSFAAGPEYDADDDEELISPRQGRFESGISGDGIVRQGDGWTSGLPRREVKPSSSIASLRERARALLGDRDRHIVDLSKEPHHKIEKRSSRLTLRGDKGKDREEHFARPGTPGAQSVLGMRAGTGDRKMKGWVKSLKGAMGMGKREES
ncbi:hypothetical protein L204_106293 [Cryptococcus depauperatus]|nr:CAMK/CAMKL protein kinase [Cryptococcus depauperatus CBS 7855]